MTADIEALPLILGSSFDHVIGLAYHFATGTKSPNRLRALATRGMD